MTKNDIHFTVQNQEQEEQEEQDEQETIKTYSEIIRFLYKESDKVMAIAKKKEEFINKLEKVNRVCRYHLVELSCLVNKVMRILSIKDTYQHFYIENQVINEKNMNKFIFLTQRYYDIRLSVFKKDMKMMTRAKIKEQNEIRKYRV